MLLIKLTFAFQSLSCQRMEVEAGDKGIRWLAFVSSDLSLLSSSLYLMINFLLRLPSFPVTVSRYTPSDIYPGSMVIHSVSSFSI